MLGIIFIAAISKMNCFSLISLAFLPAYQDAILVGIATGEGQVGKEIGDPLVRNTARIGELRRRS